MYKSPMRAGQYCFPPAEVYVSPDYQSGFHFHVYFVTCWLYKHMVTLRRYFCTIALLLSCVLAIVLTIDANTVFDRCLLTSIWGLFFKKHCTWILTHLMSLVCSVHVSKQMSVSLICLFLLHCMRS